MLALGLGVTSAFAQARELRIGLVTPPGHVWTKTANRMADRLPEVSGDKLSLAVFAAGQLGSEQEMFQQVSTGLLDAALMTAAISSLRAPSVQGWFTPYLFEDIERAIAATRTAAAQEMLNALSASGVVAQVSIAEMFGVGIVPGLVLFLLLFGIAFIQAGRSRDPDIVPPAPETESRLRATSPGVLTMAIPLMIVGGISWGVFTPTESAAVAIVIALVLGGPFLRDLKLSRLPGILDQTISNTAIVLFLIMAAKIFGWVLTFNQVPQAVASGVAALTSDPTLFILLVVGLLIGVGISLDGIAALIIMVPILLSVATGTYGIDPAQFGVMVSLTLVLGLLTPPVGAGLYVAAAIAEVPVMRLSWLVAPYVAASLAVVVLVVLLPWTSRPF